MFKSTLSLPENYKSEFPVSYTFSQLQKDIEIIAGWPTKDPICREYFLERLEPERNRSEGVGSILNYERIRDWKFVRCMEEMYNYAYFGIDDANGIHHREDMDMDAFAYAIEDLSRSGYLKIAEKGISDAARRCYRMIELANARKTLEADTPFYYPHGDSCQDFDIHQVSLLTGYEEQTIRSQASKTREDRLITYKDQTGGTRVTVNEAKRFAIKKRRYLPVKRQYGITHKINLAEIKVESFHDLSDALNEIYAQRIEAGKIDKNVQSYLVEHSLLPFAAFSSNLYKLQESAFSDSNVRLQLANILEINPLVLNVRYKEAQAKDMLRDVQNAKRELMRDSEGSLSDASHLADFAVGKGTVNAIACGKSVSAAAIKATTAVAGVALKMLFNEDDEKRLPDQVLSGIVRGKE